MLRKLLAVALLLLAAGAVNAKEPFIPPPPLPTPGPYPSGANPYQEQVMPLPNQGNTPTPRPASDANRPYFGFGVTYPSAHDLPPMELSVGINDLLGLNLLSVRADLRTEQLRTFSGRLNALVSLGGPGNFYVGGGPRWGWFDDSFSGLYYGAAGGIHAELGQVRLQIELRLDSPIERLTLKPVAQLSLLYFP